MHHPTNILHASSLGTIKITAIVIASIVLGGTLITVGSIYLVPHTAAPPGPINTVMDANNQFTFDLYSNLKNGSDGNIFFSPHSIFTDMVIAYEGANGQTAGEMQSVFHFPSN